MKNRTLQWLYTVPGRKKLYIVALTLLQALHGASGVLYALLLRGIVDNAAAHDSPGFWRYLAFLIGLVVIQLILRALIRWLTELSKSTLENIFKGRLMDTLLHRDYLQVSAVHSGEWLNRLTNDAKVVADSYVDILPGLAGMAVKLVSALVMILIIEPRFAYILIPGGAVMICFTWLFRRRLKTLHKRIQEADGRLRVFLQERIGNMLIIRSFAAEKQTGFAAAEKMQEHQSARMRRNHFSNFANIGFGMAMSGMYLLGVGWCGYGILKGTISFGTLTAITQLIAQIQSPFANITAYLPRYYAMLASAERLMEAEGFDEDGAGTQTEDSADAKTLDELRVFYEKELKDFGLKNASFAYLPTRTDRIAEDGTDQVEVTGEGSSPVESGKDGMPVVLKHLSLRIRKGETVAFTGHSGCGKSTALKLLMCVYQPDSGERYYTDREGGRGSLTSAYRRLFAYVPQGNALMNGTIREVVSFAEPETAHDEERLAAALRIACAEEFVAELPDGVDTLLGERGTGLSEGQMQRLAIARAIFSGSPVLLLDEATRALDLRTEERLLRNLRSMTDKTVVIVTHRQAALTICDRVMEFTEDGVNCHES